MAALTAFLVPARPAQATEISASASTRICAINEQVVVDVSVTNPSQASAPMPDPSNDFDIRMATGVSNPSYRRSISIVNGKQSNLEEYLYRFVARPKREGPLVLPSFVLNDSGTEYRSDPIRVLVSKTVMPPVRGEVFSRVVTPRATAYLGEPVDAFLEVFVREYEQEGVRPLRVADAFQLCWDRERSSFGVFDSVKTGSVSARYTKLRDGRGILADYCVFTWETTLYPTGVGPVDFGDIQVAWNYPTWIVRVISPMHGQPPRPMVSKPTIPPLEIKPLPSEGRPADFNGAIGRFEMTASAAPTRVPVGDPITLTLSISGEMNVEHVSAPKLDQVPALTKDFELSGESLTSEVFDDRRVFSQTIRALRDNVKEIPALPFSYFDPTTERYETRWSLPIAVAVRPAQRVALPTSADSANAAPSMAPLVETTSGLQANHINIDDMLADHAGGLGVVPIVFLGSMPLLYTATWLALRRSTRFREDVALRRRTFAYSCARKALDRAGSRDAAAGVRSALLDYVADRWNVPAAGLTRSDAVALLTRHDVAPDIRSELDQLLEELEFATYSGARDPSASDATERARRLIDAIERAATS